jgi:hypothetical protein
MFFVFADRLAWEEEQILEKIMEVDDVKRNPEADLARAYVRSHEYGARR